MTLSSCARSVSLDRDVPSDDDDTQLGELGLLLSVITFQVARVYMAGPIQKQALTHLASCSLASTNSASWLVNHRRHCTCSALLIDPRIRQDHVAQLAYETKLSGCLAIHLIWLLLASSSLASDHKSQLRSF